MVELPRGTVERAVGVGHRKLALVHDEYWVVQERFMPYPECHARKMRNQKGGLGSNTHQCSVFLNIPLFTFIIAPTKRILRRFDITLIGSALERSVHVESLMCITRRMPGSFM